MSVSSPFLSTMDRLSDDQQERIAQILENCMIELENGNPVDIDALTNEYPELREPLRRCLASLQTLHDAVQDLNETLPDDAFKKVRGRLGEFELREVLGRGGMGIVYSAIQTSLNRRVAIKVMQAETIGHPNRLRRFQLEAQAAGRLQHPNIVPVFAVGEEMGVHYYAMQLIEGNSLDHLDSVHWAHENYRTLIDAAIDIASAIQHAHECGIVHRDIKPSNILLDATGKVWITDFGLAHLLNGHSMTQSGDVLGTANYMSPEQALGRPVDERTDIYSLATTLYEMATGVQAFPGARLQDVLRKIELEEPTPLRQIKPDIPLDLETILLKGMSKDREDRYVHAQAFVDDLKALRDGLPIRGRRPTFGKIASKWVARHKPTVVIGLGGLGLALLVSLIALVNISNTRHRLSLALAESQSHLKTSNENYWQSRTLLDRWNKEWLTQLASIPAAQEARSAMLAGTIEYYESFLDRAILDPYLSRDLSVAHLRLGQALAQKSELDRAAVCLQAAITGWSTHEKETDRGAQHEWAIALNDLGLVRLRQHNPKAAVGCLTASIQMYQSMTANVPRDAYADESSLWADKAAAHLNLSQAYAKIADESNTQLHSELAESIYRMLDERGCDQKFYAQPLALLLDHRVTRLVKTDSDKALQVATEACGLHREQVSLTPNLPLAWQSYGSSLHNLAVVYIQIEQLDKAIDSLRMSLKAKHRVTQLNPTVLDAWIELATSYNALAMLDSQAGHLQEACDGFERASIVLEQRIALDEANPSLRLALAGVLTNWAKVTSPSGHIRERFAQRIRDQLDIIDQHNANHKNMNQDLRFQNDSLRRELDALEVQS
ncbi:MAG: serine/threonine-protein kinase [Pirellula sp.]